MKRTITIKADNGNLKINSSVKIDLKGYTREEVYGKVSRVKNSLYEMWATFFHYDEITIK